MHICTSCKLIAFLIILTGFVLLQIYPAITRAQDSPMELTLLLGDYRFTPDSLEVQASRPVILTLINKDGVTPHNFTLQDTDAGMDISRNVAAGSTVVIEFTPERAGSYGFYCNKKLPFMKSHHARGMEGTLNVKTPTPE